MTRRRQCKTQSVQRQHGAVAIIVAICIVVLVGMLGLVLDLGHLYVAKTELQNAADAAALSGAKEFNGKLAGVNTAISRAIEAAGKNKYNLNASAVTITTANLSAGSCPDDGCMVPISTITSDALAADKTFLKVDTGSRSLSTWFIQVLPGAPTSTATFGMAVAGKYEVDVSPIAICQVPVLPLGAPTVNEFGYERGVSYQISDFNPIGPGTLYWVDPESATPGICNATSTPKMLPYVCAGKTAFTPIVGQTVNTNTGVSDPQVEALNSRFDDYPSKSKCDPVTAPPDTNIKEYATDTAAGSPSKWMSQVPTPVPTQQTISCSDSKCKNGTPLAYSARAFADYGVLWSAYRPVGKTVSNWSAYYKGNATSYPEPSPYAQTSGNFFLAPSAAHRPGVQGRRVLNIIIVDCSSAGGVCRPATVLGIGKFFMQKKASGPKDIYVEFGGVYPNPLPTSDIKLYR